ncbi:acyltransferase [Kytococcus sp. HMSC28H12]|uniref:acyltransferase family protein n=1 Tax=Kytococcus sp. HMSC28H12 TaxID=1581067 RepID=UPI0009F685A7|nr:acyltransferase [Kytococcus sp. HMSC28H12]
MDALRGVAVLLVVLLHVPVLPTLLGDAPPEWLERTQFALQPYRMPTLLFLSGMLLEQSLRKGVRRYLTGKVEGIVWPWVVWTVITTVALREVTALLSPRTWVLGYHHLWFLTILAGCYVLGLLTRKVPLWVFPIVLAVVAILGVAFGLDGVPGGEMVLRFCWWSSFFFLGAAARFWLPRWQEVTGAAPVVLGLVVVAWSVWVVLTPEARLSRSVPAYLLSVAGVLLLLWVAPRISWPEWLQVVGRNSIVWYLAHYPAIGFTWLFLRDLGVSSWWVALPLLAVVGYLVPLLLVPFARTPLFRWSLNRPPVLTGQNG